MAYAIGTFGDISSFAALVPPPPRRNMRFLTLGVTALGCGMLVTTFVAATMTATFLALDAFGSGPEIHANAPAAMKPLALVVARPAAAHVLITAEPPPVPAPSTVPPLPAATPSFVPMAVAGGPEIAPLSSVAPRMALLPRDTATSRVAPTFATAAVGGATIVSVPASTSNVASRSPDDVTPDAVPLPPRRPVGLTESHAAPPVEVASAPAAERSTPTVEPRADIAGPASGETRDQRTISSVPAAAPAQQDNRNLFQRIFGAFIQPSAPGSGTGTAVYDIAAHTVYMPNGERLEAHSGLGPNLDDPRSVSQKNRGVLPPQTYALKPREQLFHGVAALRLDPVGDGDMYGRVGMLAHSFMLGPRGDSNGCVSFKDYDKFLAAYQRGEVSRLVVVAHGETILSSVASLARN